MKKMSVFSFLLCMLFSAQAQRYLYLESHIEQRFLFVLGDTSALSHLDELERIRYEGHYKKCLYTKQILPGYTEEVEWVIDSDDHAEPWMQLARRFVMGSAGTTGYDAKGRSVFFKANDSVKMAEKAAQASVIERKGIHPGLVMFPLFTEAAVQALKQQGMDIVQTSAGVCVKMNEVYVTFNTYQQRIIREYQNNEGENIKETTWYEVLKNQQGYVPRMFRKERSFTGNAGQCLTEVNLVLYSENVCDDPGKLMQKAIQAEGLLSVYPNPGDGVFQVHTETGTDALSWIRIINVQTGAIYQPDLPTTASFELNITSLPAGQYTLQVGTVQGKVLSCSILKR